jgi:hypothetical protein
VLSALAFALFGMGGSGKADGGRYDDHCFGFHGVVVWLMMLCDYRYHAIHQPWRGREVAQGMEISRH